MKATHTVLIALGALSLLQSCGFGDDEESAPAPVVAGQSDETFSLANGTYFVSEVRDLKDGCQKRPLDAQDSISQVPFQLDNDGNGNVALDFCLNQGRSLRGVVRGNRGSLYVLHTDRARGLARFDQECQLDLQVLEDNRFRAAYVETQRNRNRAMREATVDLAECTTSFTFEMRKRD